VVENLPSNIGTGRVTGRFTEAKLLVNDIDGIVNLYPYTTETVTFTSTATVLVDTAAAPDPVVILPKPIVCNLDSQGYMVNTVGNRWVDLIATNDPDVLPTNRKWHVTFSAGLVGLTAFDMTLATGATVDLTTLIPT
jgi:hypothetical protein